MSSYQICLILGVLCAIVSMAMSQQPTYLPPKQDGYNYPKPSSPFPPQRPTPGYQRPPPTPSYPTSRPSYPTSRPPYIPPKDETHDSHDHHHHEPGMPFDFNYKVNEPDYGNDYSHNAISDGDVVKGEYRVQLPDGRLQIVRYTADWKHGFNAEVSYEGQARYPDQQQPGFGGYN